MTQQWMGQREAAETATQEHDHCDRGSWTGASGSSPIDAAQGELNAFNRVDICMSADHWKTSFLVPRFETAASQSPREALTRGGALVCPKQQSP